ncbi:hypothetical protein D3C83_202460 [compost metagenome]
MRLFEKMQQQPSHRVGRAPAIVEHLAEARVAALHDVLRERIQQVMERLQRQAMLADDARDIVK